MYSVFSNYLKWSWPESKKNDGVSIKSIIEHMRDVHKKDKFHGYYCIEINPHIIVDSPLTKDMYNMPGTYVFECFTNKDLVNVIKWINKNILLQMTEDSCITTGVKTRIATGMINKLVWQNKLDKNYGVLAHNILVANVEEIRNKILDEDLPF